MSDDREDFEQYRLAADVEGDAPVDAAEMIEWIDAAQREEDAAMVDLRFGERLLAYVNERCPPDGSRAALRAIAEAIDADAALIGADAMRYAAELEAKRLADLRQKIEAAIDSLAYPELPDGEGDGRRVIWEAKLRESLVQIFGERSAWPPVARPGAAALWFQIPGANGTGGLRVAVEPNGEVYLWPVDPACGEGFALFPDASRSLEVILRAFLPGDVATPEEHGGVAQGRAIVAIEQALGMQWKPAGTGGQEHPDREFER